MPHGEPGSANRDKGREVPPDNDSGEDLHSALVVFVRLGYGPCGNDPRRLAFGRGAPDGTGGPLGSDSRKVVLFERACSMKRRPARLVALTVTAGLALTAACSSGSGGNSSGKKVDFGATPKGTLSAWAFDNADDVGKARIADAKTALSGVTIKMDQTGFDSQKFTTRVAGGNVPDVVQMDRQFVATYAAQNLILPLDDCYKAQKVDPKDRYYKSVLDDVTYKDKVWAVPQFYQPPAIMLDKKVMDAAGVTNDEIDTSKPDTLIAAAKKMYKSSGGVPSVLGFDPVPTGQTNLWVIGLGGQLIDKDGKPTLDNAGNVYPLEMLKKLTDAQGGWAKIKSFTDRFDVFGGKNQFVKNQVGAQVNAQWYPNVLAEYKDKITIDAVPFKDKDGKPVTVSGGSAFVIPAKAKNPAAACKWAVRLTAEENWMAAAQARATTLKKSGGINTGLFTGSPKADQDIKKQYVKPSGSAGFDQVIETTYQVLDGSKGLGSSPVGQQIRTALDNAIVQTLLGQKSAKDALKAAQQTAMNSYNQTKH
jgi:multiple sugar transport system substrate-binding protein